MADLIRLLPDHVANQIAAGEVVQRPASVVKELLENSVDSGATRIIVVVKDAGRTLVQVTDDGRGMSPADARASFERHATSKIREADDLSSLRTMGFRGEALASIAAIAQVELRTREHDEELGTRVLIEGSKVRIQEPMAGAVGTTIAVRSLFYNVPARRQFLKSDGVELKHVLEEFHRVALAHPEIAFQFVHNDQEEFHLPTGSERQRIVHLFGRKYDERLVPVEESTEFLQVGGFVGKPEFAKRSRGEQYFFVNHRYIRSNYLDHAVRKAYDELVSRENYPSWFLFLELDPAQIDINIHPTKTEIKFRDDRTIYAIVHAAVRRALGRFNIVPSLDFEPEPAILTTYDGSRTEAAPLAVPTWRPQDLGAFNAPPRKSAEGWQQLFDVNTPTSAPEVDLAPRIMPSRENEGMPGERPVFQLHGTYILAQLRSGFMVVDQQRAHERILYERNLKLLEKGAGLSQTELFPRHVELSTTDLALMEDVLPELRSLGFDLELFGGRTVQVNGMPAEAAEEDPTRLLEELLEQLKNERGTLRNERHHVLARSMARSTAIRPGRVLTTTEMHDLIDRLFACEMPYHTPAGKPTLITYGLDELNERFER
ncbi:MAG TPA: DNA mismatch repair endonuclease MutL [Flavobacteriales bacterium]|jgi:DNA mismatch repair protein MutL|nr:DNA mismatch repair endonuclease MutL [Flavobacteriales bacterium]MBK7110967.1 DNA mismatch repair endonuclease MutL [Flavobacteriales bacterium]MBK7617818.1 DNA mismatch repair endonuclease MutL [Flavobacteriales bacterium]MBK8707070.1 DNA mismatch repair endonuclease MutL [Flavobacteriales bacterium]HQW04318.1 DNA mismatch repair endonuclease MutL [Flavobacteriales bacterium]